VPPSEPSPLNTCWIALGGNLGDVAATFAAALTRLQRSGGVQVVRRSRLYDTTPIGRAAGSRFLNAAAELRTTLEPLALLDRLQEMETNLGRIRDVRWGPRTIDLDLLLWGEEVIETPRLTVPHPGLWYRRFMLDPLAEIAPQAWHPVFRLSIAEMRERLLPRPLPLAVLGPEPEAAEFYRQLAARFPGQLERVFDVAAAAVVLPLPLRTPPTAPTATVLPQENTVVPQVMRLESDADPLSAAVDLLTAALDEPRVVTDG
jgi:2-amino-4-hydroxy-6-hydroxymethyldihydropteridine diphosphokinase